MKSSFKLLTCTLCILLLGSLQNAFADKGPRAELAKMGVNLDVFPVDATFANAISKTALNFACSDDILTLERAFRHFGLVFDGGLVRTRGARVCHVWYQPSMPGFQADPDNWPVSDLYFDVNTLSYFSFRESVIGDSLDIVKQLLQQVSRPLKVSIGIAGDQDGEWRQEATEFHFPNSIHRLQLRNNAGVDSANPWAQDYLKSGRVGQKRKILITRSLFEGSQQAGQRFQPLLNSFDRSETVRSNLSWEGGDLLFVQHPWNPKMLVIVYGNAAKAYWGNGLTDDEYAYVLKSEFGADYAVDMSGLEAHVDYAAAFLPAEKIVLVSCPLRNNLEIARAAWTYLREAYPDVQAPEFQEVDRLIREGRPVVGENSQYIDDLLHRIRERNLSWTVRKNPQLISEINAYIQTNCPSQLSRCLSVDHENRVLRRNLGFMNEWVTESLMDWTDHRLPDRLLAIVSSQLPSNATPRPERLEAKARELERMGFKVVRVPKIAGNGELGVPWTGISYVNSLFVEPNLFVPNFGLGTAESRLIEDLGDQLPSSVRVVPIYAQHMLLYNGGIHCVSGIVRAPSIDADRAYLRFAFEVRRRIANRASAGISGTVRTA